MPPVTRKAKVTRATRRDEIAGRLFEIVERLLEEGSAFSEISVEQLITEAGIARSTFYVYFEDKGALMVDLMDRATQDIGAAASDWFELPATATRDDLRKALSRLARGYRQHGRMLAAIVEAAAYDPRVRDEWAAVLQRRFQDMNNSFVPQQKAGAIRADVDVASVTPWLAWMFDRGFYHLVGQGGALPKWALEGATSVVWQTLYEGTR